MTSLLPSSTSSMNNSILSVDISQIPDNTVFPVYLIGRVVTTKDRTTDKKYNNCCVSLMKNLNADSSLKLEDVIKGKRIGAIHVQNHEIKSFTVTEEMLAILNKANITGVTFLEEGEISSACNETLIRKFTSEEQYLKYVKNFIQK